MYLRSFSDNHIYVVNVNMTCEEVARPERFELPTLWFVARYSIQLSYGRAEVANYTDVRRFCQANI